MKKILGYIPVEAEEIVVQVMKETEVKKIEGAYFKLAQVWIPGVANNPKPKENRIYNACGHQLLSYKFGYVQHSIELERRIQAGQKQELCSECGLFLFPEERNKKSKLNIGKKP